MKTIILATLLVTLTGCYYKQKESEIVFKDDNGKNIVLSKVCIDGVTYLQSNGLLVPKFNKESKVEVCENKVKN